MASPVSRTTRDWRTQPGAARVLPRKIHQAPTARDGGRWGGGSRWRAAVNPAAGAFQRFRPRHETQDAKREGRRGGWGRRKSDSDSPRWALSSNISARKTGDPEPPPLSSPTSCFHASLPLTQKEGESEGEREGKKTAFFWVCQSVLSTGATGGRKSGRFHLSNLTSDWALKEKGAVCSHDVCKLRHEDKKNKKNREPCFGMKY